MPQFPTAEELEAAENEEDSHMKKVFFLLAFFFSRCVQSSYCNKCQIMENLKLATTSYASTRGSKGNKYAVKNECVRQETLHNFLGIGTLDFALFLVL